MGTSCTSISNNTMPTKKMPIMHSVEAVERYLRTHGDRKAILYLAHKDRAGWDRSTSRIYMNQISPELKYLPIDIAKDDLSSLKKVYALAKHSPQVIAINQTQPHKSNPVVKRLFRHTTTLTNIDTIIKHHSKLVPYSLNATAFLSWYTHDVGSLRDTDIVIIGVGGTGEPIARQVRSHKPRKLFLIDPIDKQRLAVELSLKGATSYHRTITDAVLREIDGKPVIINASGKEGVESNSSIHKILRSKGRGTFVDLRPQLKLALVEGAKKLGWKAYTGFGMNVRNDYTFLKLAATGTDIHLPSLSRFTTLVKKAS